MENEVIKTRPITKEYGDGWDGIWGNRELPNRVLIWEEGYEDKPIKEEPIHE